MALPPQRSQQGSWAGSRWPLGDGSPWAEGTATLVCCSPKQTPSTLAGFSGKLTSACQELPCPTWPGSFTQVTSKPQDRPWRQGLESLLFRRNDGHLAHHTVTSAHCSPHSPTQLQSPPPQGRSPGPRDTALHAGLWDQWVCAGAPGRDGTSPARGLWGADLQGESLRPCGSHPRGREGKSGGWRPSGPRALPGELHQPLRPDPRGPLSLRPAVAPGRPSASLTPVSITSLGKI